jgi:hypothetical protein
MNSTTNNDKTVLKMGAMINTNRSVVIRLQQIMCSQKIYGGVVIRQLQIMCSNNMSEMPFVALESVLLIFCLGLALKKYDQIGLSPQF